MHSKCSKTLICCESIFMSVSYGLPLSLSLPPSLPPSLYSFFPSCLSLSFSFPWSKLTEARQGVCCGTAQQAGGESQGGFPPPPLAGPALSAWNAPTPDLPWGLCTSFCQQLTQINSLQAVTLCGFFCSHSRHPGSGVKRPFRERRPIGWMVGCD